MLFIDDEYSLFFVKCLIIGLCNLWVNCWFNQIFVKCLIIGLCNLWVNCWFNQILLLIAAFSIEHLLPKVADVYQTISKPLSQDLFWYSPKYFGLVAISNDLLCQALQEAAVPC